MYIAGYARPEIEYRNIEWAVRHGYTLVEANQIIRENKRCVRDDSVMAFGIAASVFAEMHNGDKDAAARPAADKPAGSIKETPAARWRDASEVPNESGEYTVAVRWIADGKFHTGKDIAMFNSETGNWGVINSLDEYAITH